MRILLDENLPRRLRRYLAGHSVRTAQQQGWGGVSNGELLRRAASSGFDVLLTADQGLRYQQNATGLSIRVIVLAARRNKLEDLLPLLPAAQAAIRDAQPGEIRVVRAA